MKNIILFKSHNDNEYLYNTFSKGLYLLDTITSFLAVEMERGRDIDIINTEFVFEKFQLIIDEKELLSYKNKIKYYFIGYDKSKIFDSQFVSDASVNDIYHCLANRPQIVFEVTEQCNLQCKYCAFGDYYTSYESRIGKDLSIDSAIALIKCIYDICQSDYCKTLNNIINIGFYGGEPLLRFDFIQEIVSYTQALNNDKISFRYSMTTNCILLDRYADFLQTQEFSLLLSLDGDSKNNEYRVYKNGGKTFDKIYNNIKSLQNTYPEYFKKHVRFNAVLHNKNSISEILSFFNRHFEKDPLISEISTDGRLSEENENEFFTMFKSRHDSFNELKAPTSIYQQNPFFQKTLNFILHSTNLVYVDYSFLNAGANRPIKPTGTCIPFFRKIFVNAAGNVLQCERISHQYFIDKIKDENYKINVERIVKQFNSRIKKMKKFCSKCYLASNCPTCIYTFSSLRNNSITCNYYTNKEAFAIYISEIVSFIEDNPQVFKDIIYDINVA
ncbi:MAG: radical SAM peptide maturase [Firmicutes bacterium]|nr:radical SAM peptide maturase [Bacillota bacterium]